MNYELKSKTIDLGDGKVITLETGKLAKQANGSVMLRIGDTMILCTVVSNKEAKEGIDFLPLTVDYREKYASTGRFPGGFFKREARPSTDEILTMRLVDRALRPLFPDDYHSETQVMIALMSSDHENMPDALVCLAASAAIAVSDIPFNGPVSEVRVVRKDGKFIVNPTFSEKEGSDIDMIVAGTESSIVMVEGELSEISEDEMVETIEIAHKAIKVQCKAINEFAAMVATSQPKRTYEHEASDKELEKKVMDGCYQGCKDVALKQLGKDERSAGFKEVKEQFESQFSEEELAEKGELIKKYYKSAQKKAIRDMVLENGVRLDGRKTTDIRPIWSEVDYLPGTHGSSIFTRGETQSLTTLTLGSKRDEQTIDGALYQGTENFLLHYNFPPFSTGEAYPIRGTSRREIGHGNLALRALKPVIPTGTDNPYTIRIVSDILESNGSSSMATVCAGTLALMDGGVQITAPVSGIAMGLISDGDKFAVLSDILGDEDHLGDMDFKITGTAKGITACQMDIKVEGLSFEILKKALYQARDGRAHILNEMLKTLDKPREDYKPHAPRIVSFIIPKEMIGAIIGPGGKIIQEIQASTNTDIVIEEVPEGGKVDIVSANKEDIDAATKRIKGIAFPPSAEIGEEYEGKVKSIMPYGAFVEVVPGVDGLLHISELEWRKVDKVEDVLKEGDSVKFKVIGKDPKTGKLKLSRKVLMPKPEREPS
ncbi:polyribonucleotide nucleotidyltransferase [Cryomorpha ignava]|uniref:Polyribonucleotide nucleotidyltransferase n=1 Tax=Cryomorpha ignava TaxID=101383 RepID=A0A7K3WNW8_9FLAO|nr:polyribonucleotide nucleotidyltransferase [Cryomorpha ignava]NEN23359.1 polyribonucleotide nucleotidyltransferase [Cryomorpha ignava]